MTILMRLERPGMHLTVCGMVSQEWLDGLLAGDIARAQRGLTQGQLGWLETHRQAQTEGNGGGNDESPVRRAPSMPRRRSRAATSEPTPAKFDLVDTEEL